MNRPFQGFITLNARDEIYGVGGPAMKGRGMPKAAIPPRVVKRQLEVLVAVAERVAASLALEGRFLLANELHVAVEQAEREGLGRGR